MALSPAAVIVENSNAATAWAKPVYCSLGGGGVAAVWVAESAGVAEMHEASAPSAMLAVWRESSELISGADVTQ